METFYLLTMSYMPDRLMSQTDTKLCLKIVSKFSKYFEILLGIKPALVHLKASKDYICIHL